MARRVCRSIQTGHACCTLDNSKLPGGHALHTLHMLIDGEHGMLPWPVQQQQLLLLCRYRGQQEQAAETGTARVIKQALSSNSVVAIRTT